MNLTDITPPAMLERLAEMKADKPEIETLTYILGPEKMLEWAHSAGVATDEKLRELAPPIPPLELRRIVAAPSEAVFLWSGLKDAEMCASHLARHVTRRGSERPQVLDFGCGCGRTTRFLQALPDLNVHATDVNENLVAWCQGHLENVTTMENQPAPPLKLRDGQMDFIYSLSIFTHLPEVSMLAWVDELARVTADNGIVLLTTHGLKALDIICRSRQHQLMFQMSEVEARELRDTIADRRFIYRRLSPDIIEAARAGDDYGNSFTHETYMREQWTRGVFDVVDFVPGGLRGWQDVTILRRRAR